MKLKHFFIALLCVCFATIVFSSCSQEDDSELIQPPARDGGTTGGGRS